MADTGTGSSINFGTSGFSGAIMSISHAGVERPSIPTSHLGTTVAHTFMPGDLVDQGTYDLTIQFDPDVIAPIKGASETITITFPLPSGQTTAATAVFTGFVDSTGDEIPLEELMTATVTIKVSGDITYTASS